MSETIESYRAKPEAELEQLMQSLGEKKQRFVAEKHELQTQVAELNAKCAQRLRQQDYVAVQHRRKKLIREINTIEQWLGEIKVEHRKMDSARFLNRQAPAPEPAPATLAPDDNPLTPEFVMADAYQCLTALRPFYKNNPAWATVGADRTIDRLHQIIFQVDSQIVPEQSGGTK